ncbi:MAG: SDR family NAD(P)-dependent oxidoreductase [bacterium]|nr:SDR family NAD(P)-dependent oxidoreductase [bacterium]
MDQGAAIAIVGLGCRYPDATTPQELWENVLSQRRSFRRLPTERLRLEDYFSPDGSDPDSISTTEAALIEGYAFDRVRFRVSNDTVRAVDTVHWLALDVAATALEDAGFGDGEGLPKEDTGVLVGNTLTGEFSRSSTLRLRWPFVRRQLAAELAAESWSSERRANFLDRLEASYKQSFPEPTEESLAGGLSNTIGGRICNHFDLGGGGYTVDGACASSLLAVANACSALVAGDLRVALAGGVDLSLDPFELVGFSRMGALATKGMRVYDRRPTGFLPGEGCGFLVLMPLEAAVAEQRRVHAVIRGWGISSDGAGGITRPELEGQLQALRRAYRRAGFGIGSVALFEGHGTGTAVGDAVELATLNRARREGADSGAREAAAIGSIKANIGHTKAAAGVAGLIKATMALHHQRLPPTTGCEEPHDELTGPGSSLRALERPQLWPDKAPLRAGVSAMGFGGINTHLVLEGVGDRRPPRFTAAELDQGRTPQDCEVLLLASADENELAQRIEQLDKLAPRLSRAEVADLAAHLARTLPVDQPLRAAVVAASPTALGRSLTVLRKWLAGGGANHNRPLLDRGNRVFAGRAGETPRLAFLFPGQASPSHLGGGIWRRRFAAVNGLYNRAELGEAGAKEDTALAQPAIVTASWAALGVLSALGIEAEFAVGHSLGELVALAWAGAFDGRALLRIAGERGRAMSELGEADGGMAGIAADAEAVADLIATLDSEPVVIAGHNGPRQTAISGPNSGLEAALREARLRGWKATRLPVSHAFHSPMLAAAKPRLAEVLARENVVELRPDRRVSSTITGTWLGSEEPLRELLVEQLTAPVRFVSALERLAAEADFFLEVGPGEVLSGLANQVVEGPVMALNAGGQSLDGLLQTVGALFALGAQLNTDALFSDRFTRPMDPERALRFLANPCELAPLDQRAPSVPTAPADSTRPKQEALATPPMSAPKGEASPRTVVERLIAARTQLPPEAFSLASRLLTELHLSSIAVGELLTEAARELNLPPPVAPTEYANASVGEIIGTLEELKASGAWSHETEVALPTGAGSWVRAFALELRERPTQQRPSGPKESESRGSWQVFAPDGYKLGQAVRNKLLSHDGGGIVALVPPRGVRENLGLLMAAVRAALAARPEHRTSQPFVLIEQRSGTTAIARTLHLEAPEMPVVVIDLPEQADVDTWASRVIDEITSFVAGFTEVHFDAEGRCFRPVLNLLPASFRASPAAEPPLTPGEVLLVTGGGKGIAAECALSLARKHGVTLALLGRSRPDRDPELERNLERLKDNRVRFGYYQADVTEPRAVRAAVRQAQAELGDIAGLLHGAGTNTPRLLSTLGEDDLRETLAPKLEGFENLIAALDAGGLKLLIGFGSLIARVGMAGEADYGLANEQLRRAIEDFAADHPGCRSLCIEWSVWSAVGMGERLGRIEALGRLGVDAITPEDGLAMLDWLLARPTPVSVVATGRFGKAPTLELQSRDLPLLRFLERPRVHYPGVELVADCTISRDTDLYLDDHVLDGETLFPAVMALEAMAQGAAALRAGSPSPVFRRVRFDRPIVVPAGETLTLRLAALVRRSGEIDLALRCDRTAFQIDHFRATCEAVSSDDAATDDAHLWSSRVPEVPPVTEPCGLRPMTDLYGSVLFQGGRFRRLHSYSKLRARACQARISASEEDPWFGPFLPSELVLGDPGARDAFIHAIQACIPHARVLPVAVERLRTGRSHAHEFHVSAHERSHDGDRLVYDLEVCDSGGELVERWDGLELRTMRGASARPSLAASLWGPYLERRLAELLPDAALAIAVDRNGSGDRPRSTDRVIAAALEEAGPIHRRSDGKPEVVNGPCVSVAHTSDLTLVVAGARGCDIEVLSPRPESVWHDLLGDERTELSRLLARKGGEDLDCAATRVWTAMECLKKAGRSLASPLLLESITADGWAVLSSGDYRTASVLLPRPDCSQRYALSVMVKSVTA